MIVHEKRIERSDFLPYIDNIKSFDLMMDSIDKYAASFPDYLGTDIEKTKDYYRHKAKGDIFEIFTEYFMKLYGQHFDIYDYNPNHTKYDFNDLEDEDDLSGKEDLGVDGFAKNSKNQRITIRPKLRIKEKQ